MRFKCVSKSFQTQISSRTFAQLYLHHHSPPSSDFIVFSGNKRIFFYSIDSTVTPTFTFHFDSPVYLFGSSNGLLCISTSTTAGDSKFSVLNPTTRIFQDISSTPVDLDLDYDLGFAFDLENLDFKIVGISNELREGGIKTRIIKVYSLNTNSWTTIETKLPGEAMQGRFSSSRGILINNSFLHLGYWNPFKIMISSFDVCKNKWVDELPLPHFYYDPTHKTCGFSNFGNFDGRLFASFENLVESCYDVWVMKEYGVQDSWFKLLSIPVSKDLERGVVPIACRVGSDEVLIQQLYGGTRLFWYNRNNGELSEANFDVAPGFSGPEVCMRTVVDLPDGKLFVDAPGTPGERSSVRFV